MLKIVLVAIALLFGADIAVAADCTNPANQAEIAACAGAAADKADAGLNDAYGKLTGLLGMDEQVLLVEAQRAWIAFRDGECAFRTKSYEGGSIYSTLVANCLA
jgi:uncharacterized protein YecT (DUF1311 family)